MADLQYVDPGGVIWKFAVLCGEYFCGETECFLYCDGPYHYCGCNMFTRTDVIVTRCAMHARDGERSYRIAANLEDAFRVFLENSNLRVAPR